MKQQMKLLLPVIFILISINVFGQNEKIKIQVDSLKYISGDLFECNSLSWRIIANKKDAIQLLIDKLDDTTQTQAKYHCKTSNLQVGDIAFLTLERILALPFFVVTGIQFDLYENGCQTGTFEYIESNRIKFKEQVQDYYDKKKDNLKWQQFNSNKLTPCHLQNQINGRYE